MSYYIEFRNHPVTTRKSHRCGWCAQGIEAGETVPFRAYILDDQAISEWMHLECRTAMVTACAEEHDLEWTPGDFSRGESE